MPTKPFEAYPGNEPYVFVSYAHADRDVVYDDLRWLHEAGYRVWYDEGINPTENWVGVIPRRIATCTVFLVFLSPAAVASKWVRKELNLADRRDLPILPVFLSDTELDEELDFQIGSTHSLFRHQLPEDDYRRRLDRQLRKYDGLIPPALPPGEQHARELKQTADVYRRMFENQAAAPAGYVYVPWSQPCAAAGGDLHDSRILPDGRWLVMVGDVAGKGLPSSLLAAALVGMLDTALVTPGFNLPAALALVNAAFCNRCGDLFATLAVAAVDPKSHRLTLVNAGNMAPLLYRVGGELWEFPADAVGLPLGVVPDATFEAVERELQPGEALLMYTDGVTDTPTPSGEMFGTERVRDVIRRANGSPGRLIELLRAALIFAADGRRFADDVTVVAVGRNPPA